jgi:hypothetical protein
MKKTKFTIILALVTSFGFGFAFNTIVTKQSNNQTKMKKVTGIGGIFFKCKDPKKMTEWYQKHLGLNTNPYGATFEWYQSADSTTKQVHNGRHLPKQPNILNLQQRTL